MKDSSRREFLERTFASALGCAALAGGSAAYAQPTGQRRPNVVLIMTDDQGFGDLGRHGNPHIKTPNLDRLHDESLRFTQFYVCPVCAPTRASLMTGRYNYRTGAIDTYLGRAMMHADEVTMAELLGGAGYRTGIFGKWHLGDTYPLRAMDNGFQESVVHHGGGIGQPSDPPGNRYFDPVLKHNGEAKRYTGYCTDIFTDAAMAFIEQNREHPFFVYLSTNAPHTPLQIAEEYVEPYRAMGLEEETAKVYGMITNIDDNVGRLMKKLSALGVAQDTIVIFLTDNGAQGSRHQPSRYSANQRGRKGSVYEGGIHVPCFVRWPAALEGGKAIDRIAAHIDLLPTFLDACGVACPDELHLDGRSLMPLLAGEATAWPDRSLFFQWHRGDEPEPFRACAVRTQRYKLVDGKELYDLLADLGEQEDVAGQHPDVVAKLRAEYEAWFKDVSETRGYAPPRILLGAPQENPVTLTRQDWRGAQGWSDRDLGHWEVDVVQGGLYDCTLRFTPVRTDTTVTLKLGGLRQQQQVAKGSEACVFREMPLDAGPGRLEAILRFNGRSAGVRYVDVLARQAQ